MSDPTKFSDMASLSEASYVLFDALNRNFSDKAVEDALKDSNLEGRFSTAQAEEFEELASHRSSGEYSKRIFRYVVQR